VCGGLKITHPWLTWPAGSSRADWLSDAGGMLVLGKSSVADGAWYAGPASRLTLFSALFVLNPDRYDMICQRERDRHRSSSLLDGSSALCVPVRSNIKSLAPSIPSVPVALC
jgi:hypothetical protein